MMQRLGALSQVSGAASHARTAPLPAPGRLIGVDLARGVALIGMMAVHSLWAYDAAGRVTLSYSVAAGRSAATFAVLAGIGIAFLTRRRQVRPDGTRAVAAVLTTRALLIGGVGLVLGYADPFADLTSVILVYYAVLFVLAIPLVLLSTRALAVLAVAIAVAVPVASHVLRQGLPTPTEQNPTFTTVLQDPAGTASELLLTGLYPALPWLAYICIGLAVGRLDLSAPRVAGRLASGGLVVAAASAAASWALMGPLGGRDQLYAGAADAGMTAQDVYVQLVWGGSGTTPTWSWWWLASNAPHTSTPLDLLHAGGSALAVIGGCLLLVHLGRRQPFLRVLVVPLAAAGSMALTLYSAHVLFVNSPLDVFGATTGYVVQVVVVLVFAVVWRNVVGRGPLEGIVAEAAGRARRAATRAS